MVASSRWLLPVGVEWQTLHTVSLRGLNIGGWGLFLNCQVHISTIGECDQLEVLDSFACSSNFSVVEFTLSECMVIISDKICISGVWLISVHGLTFPVWRGSDKFQLLLWSYVQIVGHVVCDREDARLIWWNIVKLVDCLGIFIVDHQRPASCNIVGCRALLPIHKFNDIGSFEIGRSGLIIAPGAVCWWRGPTSRCSDALNTIAFFEGLLFLSLG